jgi:hypothetical protein
VSAPVKNLLSRLQGVRRSGKGWMAKCPAHDDRNPSLNISEGEHGRVLLQCFAGCSALKVINAAGMTARELFPQYNGATHGSGAPNATKAEGPAKADSALQGSAVLCPDIVPSPEAVSGAEILDEVAARCARYVALPEGAADMIALWSAHTHCYDVFQCSPRLNISSPEKGCGKTTLRDVVALFVPRPLCLENMTQAVAFRLIDKYRPVILADEYDGWLRDNEELRSLLNSGHRKGALVPRCEGDKNDVRLFNAYAPAVLCGIGRLPGTLHDRSIVVRLTRAKPGEVQARFDSRHTAQEKELCRKLARFCADNRDRLATIDPKLPDGVFNRLADNWRPLFAIAEIAGGDWPKRCKEAFSKLSSMDVEAESYRVMLLDDIKPMVQKAIQDGTEWLASSDIISGLLSEPERPWNEANRGKPINERWLARKLDPIKPDRFRDEEGEQMRGYKVADIQDAIERFVSPPLPLPNLSVTASHYEGKPDFRKRHNKCHTMENASVTEGEEDDFLDL